MKITLKALRVNYGLTQKEMAKVVGVYPDTWANYENARTFPNKDVLDKIEKYFGVNYNDIIFSSYLRFNRNLVNE
ncbi:transcriptional regulator [Ligilactobacillus salitolerans]|uniref:Transcriptional regulator n=1 Tax=Ligilactobacillus salitolerans TaxID=1808352 RepID=A0A401ISW4_9LACO|nr:helix-turn-helix transcriptional regulator [Ligilactobacillus salitolerans]GBG94614.1 transcriptional regulator [Ligilactobacillus salitolerans]